MEWISVKDRLPKWKEGVLVTDGNVVTVASLDYWDGWPKWWDGHGFSGYEWEFDFSNNFEDGKVTHWMPLPNPPAA